MASRPSPRHRTPPRHRPASRRSARLSTRPLNEASCGHVSRRGSGHRQPNRLKLRSIHISTPRRNLHKKESSKGGNIRKEENTSGITLKEETKLLE